MTAATAPPRGTAPRTCRWEGSSFGSSLGWGARARNRMGAARRLDLSPGRGRSEELVVRWKWRDKSEASPLKRRAREAGYAAPTGS